jgi:PST family polysaccharide transporter
VNQADVNAIAVRGMSWMILNTVAGRVIVLAVQVLLGWLLTPRDFGLYALALSVSNALGSMRNGGTSELLRQRGSRYAHVVSDLTRYSLIFNVAALLLLLAIAPVAGSYFHSADLPWLIACIGLSFPLGTLANTYRCKLAIDHRFRELAVLNTWSTLLWQAQVVALALLGCRAFSYVVPMATQGVIESAMGWYYLRHWPIHSGWLRWSQVLELLRETRWVMIGAAMLSLGLTGHYFVIGLICDPQTVGLFFFGFQLIMTLFVILNNAVENVLPATLAQLNNDLRRQSMVGLNMLRLLMVITFPLAGAVAVAAPTVIRLVWHGKWDASAGAITILAFCVPAWMVIAVVRAVYEARGMWVHRLVLLTVYGLGGILAAAIGAVRGDIRVLALYLTGFYVLFAAALALALPRILESSRRAVGRAVLPPALVCALCMVAAAIAAAPFSHSGSSALAGIAAAAAFCVVAAVLNALLFRPTWSAAVTAVKPAN